MTVPLKWITVFLGLFIEIVHVLMNGPGLISALYVNTILDSSPEGMMSSYFTERHEQST